MKYAGNNALMKTVLTNHYLFRMVPRKEVFMGSKKTHLKNETFLYILERRTHAVIDCGLLGLTRTSTSEQLSSEPAVL